MPSEPPFEKLGNQHIYLLPFHFLLVSNIIISSLSFRKDFLKAVLSLQLFQSSFGWLGFDLLIFLQKVSQKKVSWVFNIEYSLPLYLSDSVVCKILESHLTSLKRCTIIYCLPKFIFFFIWFYLYPYFLSLYFNFSVQIFLLQKSFLNYLWA